MGRIRRLPPVVANQIAAGEVVERPAAVVRELVENAIDAGAGVVSVAIRGAGKAVIRVTDDGIGMRREDAHLALERHATSKIESVEDLAAIGSLGFRGEALPSIASVSRFRLRTRERDADAGWELFVEGGAAPVEKPVGMAPGTVVEVRDLFFNIPARRKFLRSDRTERAHIVATLENLAACWPPVRFELTSDGRAVRRLDPAEDAAGRLAQLEGKWAEEAIAVEASSGSLAVRAFLAPPMAPRGAASGLRLFVNGRPIRDRRLFHAVVEAYRRVSSLTGIPRGRVFLEAAPEQVDVNVHPAKSEVRFADHDGAYRAVFRSVLAALEGAPKQVDLGPAPARRRPSGSSGSSSGEVAPGRRSFAGGAPDLAADRPADGLATAELLYGRGSGGPSPPGYLDFGAAAPTVIGQFRQSYILAEDPHGLALIDQHAAEERVLYDQLMDPPPDAASAPLLQPVTVELSSSEEATLERDRDRLAAVGFAIEDFGGESGARCCLVRRVPAALGVGDGIAVLRRALGGEGGECVEDAAHDARARVMARLACHAAVTANTPLAPRRMEGLVAALWRTTRPSTCPHGRPTVLRIDTAFLERRFGRR